MTEADPFPATPLSRAVQAGHFPVIVSLPRHDMDLARAAVLAGADALKLHLNVHHRASGTVFGPFAAERPFFEAARGLGLPLLVVPGAEHVPDADEMAALADLGVEGFNVYGRHLRPHLLAGRMRPMPALDDRHDDAEIDRMSAIPGAWIEASITPFAQYRTALDAADLARFARIAARARVPVLVPSQKHIAPGDIPALRQAGIAGVILGVVVTGMTADSLRAAVAAIVAARDADVTGQA